MLTEDPQMQIIHVSLTGLTVQPTGEGRVGGHGSEVKKQMSRVKGQR